MTSQNDHQLILLMQNLHAEVAANHREVMSQLKDHEAKVAQDKAVQDEKISALSDQVQKHEHTFRAAGAMLKWSLPSGGALAVAWAALVALASGHPPGSK